MNTVQNMATNDILGNQAFWVPCVTSGLLRPQQGGGIFARHFQGKTLLKESYLSTRGKIYAVFYLKPIKIRKF